MNAQIKLVLLIAGLITLNSNARAEQACSTYAEKAVNQYNTQQQASCHLGGLRWNNDQYGQQAWCNSAHAEVVDTEQFARSRTLLSCIANGTVVDMDDMDKAVWTLDSELMSAAARGDTARGDTARMLQVIAAGANFTQKGETLMVKAINQKDYELMQVLLRLGVPLTAQGKNPLGRMSYYSSTDPAELQMLEWLLKNGLSPNDATENPYSPLYYAVKHNNDQAVRVLLRYAANPNMNRTGYTDCSMALPLDIAISQGNDAMVTQLRRAGAYTQTNCR